MKTAQYIMMYGLYGVMQIFFDKRRLTWTHDMKNQAYSSVGDKIKEWFGVYFEEISKDLSGVML